MQAGRALMAATRDQAARIIRSESDADERVLPHAVPEHARTTPADEPGPRNAPAAPLDAPETAPSATTVAAPKSGKRKFVVMGLVALLALAAAGYGTYYTFVGRFYVSTDDAYVRSNNTMLGARVAGHIAAI